MLVRLKRNATIKFASLTAGKDLTAAWLQGPSRKTIFREAVATRLFLSIRRQSVLLNLVKCQCVVSLTVWPRGMFHGSIKRIVGKQKRVFS